MEHKDDSDIKFCICFASRIGDSERFGFYVCIDCDRPSLTRVGEKSMPIGRQELCIILAICFITIAAFAYPVLYPSPPPPPKPIETVRLRDGSIIKCRYAVAKACGLMLYDCADGHTYVCQTDVAIITEKK